MGNDLAEVPIITDEMCIIAQKAPYHAMAESIVLSRNLVTKGTKR